MSDLIDRNEAIEAIEFEKVYMTAYKGSSNRYVSEGNPFTQYNKGLDDAIKAINSLTPVKPEPKWIPVTESLPKPWQEVLTTYEYNGKRFVQVAEYAGQKDEKGNPLFCACSDEFAPDHYDFVYVAWQPLPEPWRGES